VNVINFDFLQCTGKGRTRMAKMCGQSTTTVIVITVKPVIAAIFMSG